MRCLCNYLMYLRLLELMVTAIAIGGVFYSISVRTKPPHLECINYWRFMQVEVPTNIRTTTIQEVE